MTLDRELHEQPEVLARWLDAGDRTFPELRRDLATRGARYVVVAARGTSDNAARYAGYVWGMEAGLPVALATPSAYLGYGRPPRLDGALVVGLSQSGASPDLVAVLAEARRQGRPTVAVTNDTTSPLARTADHVVGLGAGPELAVAATKTYTAELLAVAALAHALGGADRRLALTSVPAAVAAMLAEPGADALADVLADAGRVVVLGRGFHLATAHEWALKLQELASVVAQPWSTADLLHGPVAAVDATVPVLAVVSAGPLALGVRDVLSDLAGRGVRIGVVTDVRAVAAVAGVAVPLPDVPEWLAPIVAIVAGQRCSVAAARARGLDPEHPRGLAKVTRTR
ncbi:MAG: SIS domain-containing protein [Actinobacteria bacterium]|nr:SIS domain-containing protein [Actinomycetota bacterium]